MSYTVCTLQYLQFAVQKTWVTCKTATTVNCTNCIYKKGGTMTEYRFTLQKYKRGSKLTCPKCGRKQCFVKYVDTEGQIAFPDYVGRCDHIRANTITSHRIISRIIPLHWKKGSRGSHKQKLCSPSQQITVIVTLCIARLPTTN